MSAADRLEQMILLASALERELGPQFYDIYDKVRMDIIKLHGVLTSQFRPKK